VGICPPVDASCVDELSNAEYSPSSRLFAKANLQQRTRFLFIRRVLELRRRQSAARHDARARQPPHRSDRQTIETASREAFYAAAICASGIVPPSIIDREFLERP
jgi:hypothetical protein